MKKVTIQILAVLVIAITMVSCGKDDVPIAKDFLGNEYLIKVNGETYDEGTNIFAGIVEDLTEENVMQAGFGAALAIYFDKQNYVADKNLTVGLEETPGTEAYATGMLTMNENTGDILSYVAVEGSVKIESKNKLTFNLTCYEISDLGYDDELNYTGPVQGAKQYIISGFVTENSPNN